MSYMKSVFEKKAALRLDCNMRGAPEMWKRMNHRIYQGIEQWCDPRYAFAEMCEALTLNASFRSNPAQDYACRAAEYLLDRRMPKLADAAADADAPDETAQSAIQICVRTS